MHAATAAAATTTMTCLSAIQGEFSLSQDPKNGNLEFSITWLPQL